MDIFKFNPTGEQTVLERGEIVNNIEAKTWVERYGDLGEFTLVAKLSSGLRALLPLGTLISHTDTYEVMIVENHEIEDSLDEDPTLTITGRTFPSYLDERMVGADLVRTSSTNTPYTLAANYSWNQIVALINDHINTPVAVGDGLDRVLATTSVPGTSLINEARNINTGPMFSRVSELLAIDDLGIKTIRENNFILPHVSNTQIHIYKGTDHSKDVRFSWRSGDLESAKYLFSQKSSKNAAMVVGQYVSTMVVGTPDKYDRRFMEVDGSDIDGHLGATPVGGVLTTTLAAMATRGRQALSKQNQITVTQSDISNLTNFQYRKHYNIGDLVSIDGDFDQQVIMRVTEFAEIEDENGTSGHPTLSVPIAL